MIVSSLKTLVFTEFCNFQQVINYDNGLLCLKNVLDNCSSFIVSHFVWILIVLSSLVLRITYILGYVKGIFKPPDEWHN